MTLEVEERDRFVSSWDDEYGVVARTSTKFTIIIKK